ncbi:hypothetical protein HYW53_00395 [Candidatus Giovannonibacteria bacterium]|nr:hypothetical protein [Candidatus Giovannonibacteria bacterium]
MSIWNWLDLLIGFTVGVACTGTAWFLKDKFWRKKFAVSSLTGVSHLPLGIYEVIVSCVWRGRRLAFANGGQGAIYAVESDSPLSGFFEIVKERDDISITQLPSNVAVKRFGET